MGYKLRSLRQDVPLNQFSISSDYESGAVSIGDLEGVFSIQLTWNNGNTVDMDVELQVSNDKINWVPVANSQQNIVDNTGIHFWDSIESGAEYMRVGFSHNSGIADFTISLNGKSRG